MIEAIKAARQLERELRDTEEIDRVDSREPETEE